MAHWPCRRIGNLVQFYPADPDLSECRHVWVDDLEREIFLRQDGNGIANSLVDNLEMTTNLYGGDIAGSLALVGQLIPLERDQLKMTTFARMLRPKERADKAINFTNVNRKIVPAGPT